MSAGRILLIGGLSLVALCGIGCIGTSIFGGNDRPDSGAAATETRAVPPAASTTTVAPTSAAPTTTAPTTTAPTTTTRPAGIYDEGVLLVPSEVAPGTYRATVPAGSFGCYWARLKGTSGAFDDIIANGNAMPGAKVTVTVRSGDKAFEQHGCGDWTKVG